MKVKIVNCCNRNRLVLHTKQITESDSCIGGGALGYYKARDMGSRTVG